MRFSILFVVTLSACGTSSPIVVSGYDHAFGGARDEGASGVSGMPGAGFPSGGATVLDLPDADVVEAGGAPAAPPAIVTSLPDGFTGADVGGWMLGPPLVAGSKPAPSGDCANVITGVSRDFRASGSQGGHPDFEAFLGGSVTPGLVSAILGDDLKPVYTGLCESSGLECPNGVQTTSKSGFDQWYRGTDGVNMAYLLYLYLAPQPDGLFTFESREYFPVDGAGFADSARGEDGRQHNFGFTTEVHTRFLYRGGETFRFKGDDDVWVFVNGRLAVDVGGVHPPQSALVDLDMSASALGIKVGEVYGLDLFHAERHTIQSTFRIDTDLSLVDCGTVVPEPPPK